jgi:SAM-dependent methyltransferase
MTIYDSERLAAAYAFHRPPVHQHVIRAARARLDALGCRHAARALDLGCGAGLSTAALEPIARVRVGIEPVRTMLRHRAKVAPGSHFVAGAAERLPFPARVFDLVAAAGVLNYADRASALLEIARVLTDRGVLLVYDFSGGRRLRQDERLDQWYRAFETRYAYPPGYPMDVERLDYEGAGLRLAGYQDLQVEIPMTFDAYVAYAMSETNVEQAIAAGASEPAIHGWCRATLGPIFEGGPRSVIFDAYAAYITRRT